MVNERAFWLAWSQIQSVGPILIQRLNQHFGELSIAWNADLQALATVEGIGLQTAEVILAGRSRLDPEEFLNHHTQSNPRFWTPADPDYPRLLLEIPDPPPVLYYQGQADPNENQGKIAAIAMVGTRNPSDYGKRWTRNISKVLTQAGFVVVSGLAYGIDTEAHHSCLDAGGRTIAVLGNGVDVVYPWSNRKLAQRIAAQGLLVSEYPAGTQPDRVNFPRRNRIIAGLCRATLVMEAPIKSGALITAYLANDYARDIYALPGSIDQPQSMGCLSLIERGAQMILGEQQLLDALSLLPNLRVAPDSTDSPAEQLALLSQPLNLAPELEQVLQAVYPDCRGFDAIVQDSELPTPVVSSALFQLELMGLISQLPGMQYRRC